MKRINRYLKLFITATAGTLVLSSATACSVPEVSSEVTTETTYATEPSTLLTSKEAFTEKDLEIGYDENESETITLNGSTASSSSSSVKISDSVVTIQSKGTYIISGTLDDGYIVVDAGKSDEVRLILNDVNITSSDYAALYCLSADNVYITLEDGTENVLTTSGEFDSKDENNVDGTVFSKTDLTINGSGILDVVSSEHGIVGKDEIAVTGGTINISSVKDGIQANDSVAVQNATISITCGKDGIQADNDDDLTKGYIYIASGDITISADDDGITAATALQIDDGTVNILNSYEGIEGQNITINGGTLSITSSDDAINAVSASSSGEVMQSDGVSTLVINGGDIYVKSSGDGVDSNGSFEMTGGTLTVMGPSSGANGSLDVNGTSTITGGTVIMAGTSSMATNFTNASQGAMLINTGNQSAGTEITITDISGNILVKAVADCDYQTVLISSPDLVKDNSYTVTAGDYSETVTLTDNIYGSGSGFGMGGPGGRGGGMPQNGVEPGFFSGKDH